MNFGDSALNCLFQALRILMRRVRQLSALSPELSLALLLASSVASQADALKVAASFKPIHSLAAAIMQGVGAPYLVVKGAASPHTYSMTPSDAQALQNADVIFWIGPSMETFLGTPLHALGGAAKIVALQDAPGLETLPLREGQGLDPHLWLDPQNAKRMAAAIETALSEQDPANAAAYHANARKTEAALDNLEADIRSLLAPVRDRPFLTFHDAFQYFDRRFGLNSAGSVTLSPETPPGAARIAELRALVKARGITCVFTEPNFEPKIVNVIVEGVDAGTAALDPEASGLAEGPELYFQSLRGMADAMRTCLET